MVWEGESQDSEDVSGDEDDKDVDDGDGDGDEYGDDRNNSDDAQDEIGSPVLVRDKDGFPIFTPISMHEVSRIAARKHV